jgi:uncharacterized membrane protein YfhO
MMKTLKEFIVRFWPLFFIITLWFIFASPYIVKNYIPYPSEYQVSFFTPWNSYPEYSSPIKNNAISDVISRLYPWKYFTIEELKKGNMPLWNPYSFSGNPHLANYQSAVFSPFNALFFLLPFIDAWSIIVLLQPLLAGVFLYLYLREIKVSQVGSTLGSIAFMFCGFITVWMPYGTLGMAVAFLPLALFAIEKLQQRIQLGYVFLLALSLILSFFSGHFQISLYVACYIFVYLLFVFFRTKNKSAFLYIVGSFAVGMAVSSIQIIPSLEFYSVALRSEFFSNAGGIPWYYLFTVFAPDFFGNPVTRNDWVGHYAEWASFIGIVPLSLAFAALFIKKNKAMTLFFFFAGVITLLLALDTIIQNLLVLSRIPIFSTSIPSRIIVLFSFSLAVLAGLGFDLLKNSLKQKSLKYILILFLPSVILLLLAWIYLFTFISVPDNAAIAKRNLLLPSVLFVAMLIIVFASRFIKKKFMVALFAVALLVLTSFDSWRFVQKWMPFESKNVLYPTVPVIQKMQQEIGYGRVYGDFGAYFSVYYHLPSVEGYDPLYSKRYGELIQSAKTGNFTGALRSEVVLDRRGAYTQRVLDLLGVMLIYQPISHSNQPWAFPIWEHPENFPTVYRDDKFAVFANNSAMSRVALFSQYEVIRDEKKLIERFFDKNFDYRTVLLLEEDPGIEKGTIEKGKAEIVSYTPNRIKVMVESDREALLFLSDTYYPLWKAVVNGKEEKIYITDHALRSVKVPKGKSSVEFIYRGLF